MSSIMNHVHRDVEHDFATALRFQGQEFFFAQKSVALTEAWDDRTRERESCSLSPGLFLTNPQCPRPQIHPHIQYVVELIFTHGFDSREKEM